MKKEQKIQKFTWKLLPQCTLFASQVNEYSFHISFHENTHTKLSLPVIKQNNSFNPTKWNARSWPWLNLCFNHSYIMCTQITCIHPHFSFIKVLLEIINHYLLKVHPGLKIIQMPIFIFTQCTKVNCLLKTIINNKKTQRWNFLV